LVARPLHMALILPWVFLFAAATPVARISGAVLTGLGIAGCLWIALNHQMLRNQYGFLESGFQVVLALTMLLIAMEGARRAIGWPLPL
ncbi:TRAP transporter permease DctM/Q, partial [Halomonas marinisediminis]